MVFAAVATIAGLLTRTGWRVEDKVEAGGSSDAISGVSVFSDDGYCIRAGECAARDVKPARIVISASTPFASWWEDDFRRAQTQ